MQTLCFDDGIQEFEVNGNGVLRFNPTDPNVYDRFRELVGEFEAIEQDYQDNLSALEAEKTDENGFAVGGKAFELMRAMDLRVKERLAYAFGGGNDFNTLLGGVNLMAIGRNGKRVMVNVLEALAPLVENGANRYLKDEAAAAVEEAKRSREARGEA